MNKSDKPFFDHIDELRSRMVKCTIAAILGSFIFFSFIDRIFTLLLESVGQLVFTAPAEAFMARLAISLFGGILLSFPYIIYQIWMFVAAGLKDHERTYALIFTPFSIVFFILGGLFAYFMVIPVSVKFLLSYGSESIVPMITIKNYISFVGTLILACGIIFELPLILMFLTKIGVATPEFLIQKRRHSIIILLVLSALITPPDFITQLLLAGPLIILYEIGIVVSKITYKQYQGIGDRG